MGTDAFVIAGLLPSIGESLQVSIGQAGQLVTVFALAYAISAPLVGALAAGWPLRTAVLAALLVLSAGNAITALATGYPVVLASRVVAAVGAALYTASATSSAAALAGPARRGRAIAIVMAGTTSSLVLGAPLGTAVGAALGWRATLWLVAALGAVASLVYAPSTGGSGATLAGLLLVFGVAGTAGNLSAGALADRFGPRRVIVVVTLALAAVFTALPVLQGSLPVAVVVAAVSGVLSFGVTSSSSSS